MDISLGVTYGLPAKSQKSSKTIRELDRSFRYNICWAFGALTNKHMYCPLSIGIGKTYADENAVVKGYQGDGMIEGTHYFLAIKDLWTDFPVQRLFGVHFEIGYSK
jgi:hypothetical protein